MPKNTRKVNFYRESEYKRSIHVIEVKNISYVKSQKEHDHA